MKKKDPGSHNVVTNIQDENGDDLKIVRANMPFSNPSKMNMVPVLLVMLALFLNNKPYVRKYVLQEHLKGHTDKPTKIQYSVTGTLFLSHLRRF